MFEKSEFKDTEPVSVPSKKESNPTLVNPGGIDSEKLPVAISAKNQDIPRVQPTNVSVFGSTLVFRGELSADEEILIEGTVEGTIAHHKKNVVVGKQGRVKALIHANSVTIEGRVDGDIHGDVFVRLAESAEVSGNIFCSRITMEDGARFNGTMHMGR